MLIWVKGQGIDGIRKHAHRLCTQLKTDTIILRMFYKRVDNKDTAFKTAYLHCTKRSKSIDDTVITRLKFAKDIKDKKEKRITIAVNILDEYYEAVLKNNLEHISDKIDVVWLQSGDILDKHKYEPNKYKDFDYTYLTEDVYRGV